MMILNKPFLLCLHIGFCITYPLQNVDDSAEVAEIKQLEVVWNKAHVDGDAGALDRLWGDDLIVTVPNMAVMGKADSIRIWQTGRMKFKRYETSELRIRVYTETAIVTGRLQRGREINGKVIEDDWQFTKVYIRRKKEWQVVAWHASPSAKQ